jgi:hypothetical protein
LFSDQKFCQPKTQAVLSTIWRLLKRSMIIKKTNDDFIMKT